MDKGISVIVPCYNDGRYLEEAVASVYAQKTSLPIEILVVDDGSDDDATLRAIAALKARYPDIRVFRHDVNEGLPSARNTGLAHARYPFILPLDADDKLSTDPALMRQGNYIDRAVASLERNPDVAFAYCGVRLFDAVDHVWLRPAYNEKEILSNYHVGSFAIYRRDEALSMGGYNPRLNYGEDGDLHIALVNERIKEGRVARVDYFHEPYFMYRRRSDNSSKSSSLPGWTREVLQEIIARSPEIYARHFPGLEGDALLDEVLRQRRKGFIGEARELFQRCASHPAESIRDGAMWFTVYTIERKIRTGLTALFCSKGDASVREGIFSASRNIANEAVPSV